jgi:predicted MFS family arabinose efflux permease
MTANAKEGGTAAAPARPIGAAGAAPVPRRDVPLLLLATFAVFANYATMLPVVPLWSVRGGAGNGGAGATTGVTMAVTVVTQLCMGPLVRRFGLRAVMAAGALLLGLPTAGYLLSPAPACVLAVSAVRGTGFALVAVAGVALTAELAAPRQRARALGWYGAVAGLPQVACLPAGLWCAQVLGFTPVFLAASALCLLAVPLLAAMSGPRPAAAPAVAVPPGGGEDTGRTGGVLRPLAVPGLLMFFTACALGGTSSFLALALPAPGAAPLALLTLSAAMIVGRMAAGVLADRAGEGRLLTAAVIAAALGTAGIAAGTGHLGPRALVLCAAAMFGLGFGVLQNETLLAMFAQAGPARRATASTAWNLAYDAGTGVGSVCVGLLCRGIGVGGSLAVFAALIAAMAPLAGTAFRRPGTLAAGPPP